LLNKITQQIVTANKMKIFQNKFGSLNTSITFAARLKRKKKERGLVQG